MRRAHRMSSPMRAVALVAIVASAGPGHARQALAADPQPGLWQFSLEMRVPAQAAFTPPPFQLSQCITAADAKDPGRLLGGMATPGATGCTYTDKSYSGDSFRFSMDCTGTYGVKAKGEVSYDADNISGTIDTVSTLAGSRVEMQNRITGRRVGGC
jgi:hypothetical protein